MSDRKIELTRCGLVLTTLAVGLLDSKATSEGAGNSSVAAANSADVSGRGTDAVEVVRHSNTDGEVLLLGLRQSIAAGDVVGNLQRSELGGSIAGLVKITLVGSGTIGVDLVYC